MAVKVCWCLVFWMLFIAALWSSRIVFKSLILAFFVDGVSHCKSPQKVVLKTLLYRKGFVQKHCYLVHHALHVYNGIYFQCLCLWTFLELCFPLFIRGVEGAFSSPPLRRWIPTVADKVVPYISDEESLTPLAFCAWTMQSGDVVL